MSDGLSEMRRLSDEIAKKRKKKMDKKKKKKGKKKNGKSNIRFFLS